MTSLATSAPARVVMPSVRLHFPAATAIQLATTMPSEDVGDPASPWSFAPHREVLDRIPRRYWNLDVSGPDLAMVLDVFKAHKIDVEDSTVSISLVECITSSIAHSRVLWRDILTLNIVRRVDLDKIPMRKIVDLSSPVAKAISNLRTMTSAPEVLIYLGHVASAYKREIDPEGRWNNLFGDGADPSDDEDMSEPQAGQQMHRVILGERWAPRGIFFTPATPVAAQIAPDLPTLRQSLSKLVINPATDRMVGGVGSLPGNLGWWGMDLGILEGAKSLI